MELPPMLRQATDRVLEQTPLSELAKAAETLSRRYRAEVRDGRWHVSSDLLAKAYIATRMPATYMAVRASLDYVAELQPSYSPRTLLDVGSGTGAALWATQDCWGELVGATLLEGSEAMQRWGRFLAAACPVKTEWRSADIRHSLPPLEPHDLVILAYVLDELEPPTRTQLVARLWNLSAHTLLIVEPGTPAGWKRILEARQHLLELGAHLIAPCPHSQSCPLSQPDWCHFSRRVARSRIHRQAKGGEVPWEDEKFIYLAASKNHISPPQGRIIAPAKPGSGHVRLRLCQADGTEGELVVSKREGEVYKIARKLEWGDAWPTLQQ